MQRFLKSRRCMTKPLKTSAQKLGMLSKKSPTNSENAKNSATAYFEKATKATWFIAH